MGTFFIPYNFFTELIAFVGHMLGYVKNEKRQKKGNKKQNKGSVGWKTTKTKWTKMGRGKKNKISTRITRRNGRDEGGYLEESTWYGHAPPRGVGRMKVALSTQDSAMHPSSSTRMPYVPKKEKKEKKTQRCIPPRPSECHTSLKKKKRKQRSYAAYQLLHKKANRTWSREVDQTQL